MSSNDQVVILRAGGFFEVHHDTCVDNAFRRSSGSLVCREKTLKMAVRKANAFMRHNLVEYGLRVL